MAIVTERFNPKPPQVDPKSGKALPAPIRTTSPSLPDMNDSNSGFFGSFFAAKNKKKAAAMEPPPQILKASGTLSERESVDVEVISKNHLRRLTSHRSMHVYTDTCNRAPDPVILWHREADHDRHGSQGHNAQPRPVSFATIYLLMGPRTNLPRFTKDDMQKELLENMYRSETFDELLKESDYTVQRRQECMKMVESLSRASEIVSQVQ